MKIILISDTHGKHGSLNLPKGDIIIHAGDITADGTTKEYVNFLKWFKSLDYEYKIFIAGNHDFALEKFGLGAHELHSNIYYLNRSTITISGIKFYGITAQLKTNKWAFEYEEKELKLIWEKIPSHIDILISHIPPFGIMDLCINKINHGDSGLSRKVIKMAPQYHIFGHVHNSSGIKKIGTTTYINCSMLDEKNSIRNKYYTITI